MRTQKEISEWYRKEERKERIRIFKDILKIWPLVAFFSLIFFFSEHPETKEEATARERSALAFKKEYLGKNSLLQKQIQLLGTRPSDFKRSQK